VCSLRPARSWQVRWLCAKYGDFAQVDRFAALGETVVKSNHEALCYDEKISGALVKRMLCDFGVEICDGVVEEVLVVVTGLFGGSLRYGVVLSGSLERLDRLF